jgi:hypothetical protein
MPTPFFLRKRKVWASAKEKRYWRSKRKFIAVGRKKKLVRQIKNGLKKTSG